MKIVRLERTVTLSSAARKKDKKNCYSASRKNVQYEKNAIRKKVQHDECNTDGISATRKVCYT